MSNISCRFQILVLLYKKSQPLDISINYVVMSNSVRRDCGAYNQLWTSSRGMWRTSRTLASKQIEEASMVLCNHELCDSHWMNLAQMWATVVRWHEDYEFGWPGLLCDPFEEKGTHTDEKSNFFSKGAPSTTRGAGFFGPLPLARRHECTWHSLKIAVEATCSTYRSLYEHMCWYKDQCHEVVLITTSKLN